MRQKGKYRPGGLINMMLKKLLNHLYKVKSYYKYIKILVNLVSNFWDSYVSTF